MCILLSYAFRWVRWLPTFLAATAAAPKLIFVVPLPGAGATSAKMQAYCSCLLFEGPFFNQIHSFPVE
jgi:hypothetical protein